MRGSADAAAPLVEDHLTVHVVQKQIDTLREQLYTLNEALYGVGGMDPKKRGGKFSNLTADEHLILSRNEALRHDKAKLIKELDVREPPEVLDKKNVIREVERNIAEIRRETEQLEQIRDSKKIQAQTMQQRLRELQVLQARVNAEQAEYRQQQRELQNKVKEMEKIMLAKHSRFVRLNERTKHGVGTSEAERLIVEVREQEVQIADMEKEIRLRKHAQQRNLLRNAQGAAKQNSEKSKELQASRDRLDYLTSVLVARDTELKRSYDYAGRKLRAAAAKERAEQQQQHRQQQQQLPALVESHANTPPHENGQQSSSTPPNDVAEVDA